MNRLWTKVWPWVAPWAWLLWGICSVAAKTVAIPLIGENIAFWGGLAFSTVTIIRMFTVIPHMHHVVIILWIATAAYALLERWQYKPRLDVEGNAYYLTGTTFRCWYRTYKAKVVNPLIAPLMFIPTVIVIAAFVSSVVVWNVVADNKLITILLAFGLMRLWARSLYFVDIIEFVGIINDVRKNGGEFRQQTAVPRVYAPVQQSVREEPAPVMTPKTRTIVAKSDAPVRRRSKPRVTPAPIVESTPVPTVAEVTVPDTFFIEPKAAVEGLMDEPVGLQPLREEFELPVMDDPSLDETADNLTLAFELEAEFEPEVPPEPEFELETEPEAEPEPQLAAQLVVVHTEPLPQAAAPVVAPMIADDTDPAAVMIAKAFDKDKGARKEIAAILWRNPQRLARWLSDALDESLLSKLAAQVEPMVAETDEAKRNNTFSNLIGSFYTKAPQKAKAGLLVWLQEELVKA